MNGRNRGRRAKFAWQALETRAVPTMIIALIDSGVDLTSTTDSPFYDFNNAYDAYNQQVVTPSTHSIVQDTSLQHGHGSTVADFIVQGIKDAEAQPGAGSLDVEIMPIRDTIPNSSYPSNISPDPSSLIRGVYWAANHGASVINISDRQYNQDFYDTAQGDPYYGTSLSQAIRYAQANNVMVVTAAGNESVNVDTSNAYGSYILPGAADQSAHNGLGVNLTNLLVTAAVDSSNHLTQYSCWGPTTVDVGSPTGTGTNAVTSYSTGYTSGLAGVISALTPGQSPASRIGIIEQTAIPAPQSVGVWSTTGGVVSPAGSVSKARGSISIAVGSSSGTGGFVADAPYASGGTTTPNSDSVDVSGITNPPPVAIFQNERYSGTSFTETVPNLTPNAAYDVRLDFAETYFAGAGVRSFDVAINGSQVLTGFDIAAAAGGKDKAVAETFSHVAANSSGNLVFTFTNIAGGAKVDGIEVAPSQTIAIASGSSTATGTFAADGYYSSSQTYPTPSGITVDTSGVANPPPASVFSNSRWSSGTLTYTVPNLTRFVNYTVRLDFAETFYSGPNNRKFNVAINGSQVMANFDIAAAAGGANKAAERSFNAQPDGSGNLTISFTNVTGGATVNGIEVSPNLGSPQATQVDLSGYYNTVGITNDASTSSGNLDGTGHDSYSAAFVGPIAYSNGVSFNLGAAGANDVVLAQGQSITLPGGNFHSLRLLGTGVNGSQTGSFTVYYTDGTTGTFGQTFDDWHNGVSASGESVASLSPYRNGPNGRDTGNSNFYMYSYSFALNPSKTVASISLPNNSNIAVFAIDLIP